MLTPRHARQGSALLSIIVGLTVSASAMTPTVQAREPVTVTEGGQDRGLGRTRPPPPPGRAEPPRHPGTPIAAAALPPRPADARRRPDEATADGSNSANAAAAFRQSLNEYLIRDRTAAIQLVAAEQAISDSRCGDALAILQSVLDAPADVFIWRDGHAAPASARACAAALIRRLPRSSLDEYERRYGSDARHLLHQFERTLDPQVERTLLRRFEFTAAGAEACRMAADRVFDRGEFLQAARAFERYYRHPLAVAQSNDFVRLRAQVAAELAARDGLVVELPEFDADQTLRCGTQTQTAGAWLAKVRLTFPEPGEPQHDRDDAWRVAFGSPQAHRTTSASAPTLLPLWTASHDEPAPAAADGLQTVSFESVPAERELLESWQALRRERRLPSAGANFAIVDRGQVIARDYAGITSRDLQTGEIRWQYACAAGLRRRAAEIQSSAKSPAAADGVAAAQLFNDLFAQNSVLGMLSSDGKRVYCIDLAPRPPAPDGARDAANRLVALALNGEGSPVGLPVWELAGDGWCFLGPPLAVGECLYVIAEQLSLVSLLAINAEAGTILWSQPISLVDARIADDPQRARQACSPVQAGDLLVCPTQLGTVVGVSLRDGALEWVYAYQEASGPSQPWRKTRAFDREYGAPEYPNLPVIVGGSIIVLAPQSANVHCVDLRTGAQRWVRGRGLAHYAVTARDDLVLLVGPRDCTALRIEDGSIAWQQPIAPPAGRGLAARSNFVLPTEDGRFVALDLATGRIAPDLLPPLQRRRSVALRAGEGFTFDDGSTTDEPIPLAGNLLSCGPYIVACSPSGLSVYPQAQEVLDAIRLEAESRPLSPAAGLERGELELRLGDADAAEISLRQALRALPGSRTRTGAEARLRELLYIQFALGNEPDRRLTELDPLCTTPQQRSRFLVHRLDHELETGNVERALHTAAEIARLDHPHPVAMDAAGRYVTRPDRRAAAPLLRYALAHPADTRTAALAVPSLPPAQLAHIANARTSLDSLRAARAANVDQLFASGQLQAAELLLLAEIRHSDPVRQRAARQRLAALWKQCGLPRDAELLMSELNDVRARPAATRPARVEIRQHICAAGGARALDCAGTRLVDVLNRSREFGRQPPGSRVLFDRGYRGSPEKFSSMSVVDVADPHLVADLEPLPPRSWRTGDAGRYDAGHLIPIAAGDVYGISLLEGRILWSTTGDAHQAGDKPLLGPYGPGYCILQAHETVTALDPLDGTVLWRRSDLPFDCGLASSAEGNGMFADDTALVIFNEDHVTYRVLDPRSGELLKTGVLEPSAEPRRRGWGFGRRLLYFCHGESPRLRLWDPLRDDLLLDLPCAGRCLVDTGLGSGRAVVLTGGKLMIFDTRSAELIWSAELDPTDAAAARQVRSLCEGDRFCIHVEQDVATSPSSQATHDIGSVPNLPLGGLLFVIDRHTLQHWSRPVPRCNLLQFPLQRLPVLVTLGRCREGAGDQGAAFYLEVLDAATGETLGSRTDLTRTGKLLIHARYDAAEGIIELLGDQSEITVRLVGE